MTDILSDTPLWVWGVLVFLLERGISAMTPTRITVQKTILLPAAFSVWSAYSVDRLFGAGTAPCIALLATTLLVAVPAWLHFRRTPGLHLDRDTMTLVRPGTPAVLLLSLCGFALRYALGVAVAREPSLIATAGFPFLYGALSGIATGALWGMVLGHLEGGLRGRTGPTGLPSDRTPPIGSWS